MQGEFMGQLVRAFVASVSGNESGLSSSRGQPPLMQPARRPQLTVGGRRVDISVEGSPASDERGKVDICFVFGIHESMTQWYNYSQ